jgi:hypothetical protein
MTFLIAKCLELFIADLVKACEKVTKAKQAKTMTVFHLYASPFHINTYMIQKERMY